MAEAGMVAAGTPSVLVLVMVAGLATAAGLAMALGLAMAAAPATALGMLAGWAVVARAEWLSSPR